VVTAAQMEAFMDDEVAVEDNVNSGSEVSAENDVKEYSSSEAEEEEEEEDRRESEASAITTAKPSKV